MCSRTRGAAAGAIECSTAGTAFSAACLEHQPALRISFPLLRFPPGSRDSTKSLPALTTLTTPAKHTGSTLACSTSRCYALCPGAHLARALPIGTAIQDTVQTREHNNTRRHPVLANLYNTICHSAAAAAAAAPNASIGYQC
jgi:hypothetical protein